MTYEEFWLLEAAIINGALFSRLWGPIKSFELFWNKPYHGMTRLEVLETSCRLFGQGDIVACSLDRDEYIPSREEIDRLLYWESPTMTWYHVTAQGGARWERVAKPDWSRYFEDAGTEDKRGRPVLEITAGSVATLMRVLETFPAGTRAIERTVLRTALVPWKVSNWKTLPIGHCVRFAYVQHPIRDKPKEWWSIPDEWKEWFFALPSDEERRRERERWWRELYGWYEEYPRAGRASPSPP